MVPKLEILTLYDAPIKYWKCFYFIFYFDVIIVSVNKNDNSFEWQSTNRFYQQTHHKLALPKHWLHKIHVIQVRICCGMFSSLLIFFLAVSLEV